MKQKMNKAISVVAGVFIFIGLVLAVIGANNGGSIVRALRHSGVNVNTRQNNNYGNYYNPYGNGGKNNVDDPIRDFFREFGMSDDEIDMFVNPYGNSRGSKNKSYPIQ